MTHTSHPIRPARAAIAAVLALTATPLLAQQAPALPDAQPIGQASLPTTPPPAAAPDIAAPPAASLPGSPVPTAAPMVPDSTSGVPVTAIAPPSSLTVPQAPAPRIARQPARTATPSAAPVAADRAPAPVATMTAPSDAISEPVAAAPIAPVTTTTADPVQSGAITADGNESNGEESNGEVWGVLAALLAALGIGGGAIALTRTRTRKSAVASAAPHAAAEQDRTAPPASISLSRPALAGPHERPVAPAPQMIVPPTRTAPSAPIMRATSDERAIDPRRLEYMIAQRPSRENPFVTRPNRKRRAVFLLQNRYPMQSAA